MGEFITKDKAREILGQIDDPGMRKQVLQRMVDRGYEFEGLNASFNFGEAVSNVPGSLWELGKNVVSVFTDFPQTVDALSSVAKGAMRKIVFALPGKAKSDLGVEETTDDEAAFDALVGMFKERYGGTDRILNTLEKDPAGFAADVSALLGGVGAATGGVGKVGNFERLSKIGKDVRMISRAIEPTMLPITSMKTLRAVVPEVASNAIRATSSRFMEATGLSKSLSGKAAEFGEKALQIPQDKAAKLANKTFKEPPGATAAKFGMYGTPEEMADQAKRLAKNSKDIVDRQLASVDKTFRSSSIRKSLNILIDDLQGVKSQRLLRTRRFLEAMRKKHDNATLTPLESEVLDGVNDVFKRLKPEFAPFERPQLPGRVGDFVGTPRAARSGSTIRAELIEPPAGLSLSEINEVRRIFDAIDSPFNKSMNISGIGKVSFEKTNISGQDLAELRGELSRLIKKRAAENGFKHIDELNRRTIYGTEMESHLRNAAFSLKGKKSLADSIIFLLGLGGSVASANPEFLVSALGITVSRRFIQSPKVRSLIATRMMQLSDSNMKSLQNELRLRRLTPKNKKLLTKIINSARKTFPELQLVGKSGQAVISGEQQ